MKRRARITALIVALSALLAVPIYLTAPAASAQTEALRKLVEGIEVSQTDMPPPKNPDLTPTVRNHVIDCSTNKAYRDRSGMYADFVHGVGHKDCRSCHRSASPVAGQGDRPETLFASFSLWNKSDKAAEYELKVGEKGEYTKYTIEPGKRQRFAWRYPNPKDRRSPHYVLRYEGSQYTLTPFATPNAELGTLYYFANDRGGDVQILTAKGQPYRRR